MTSKYYCHTRQRLWKDPCSSPYNHDVHIGNKEVSNSYLLLSCSCGLI